MKQFNKTSALRKIKFQQNKNTYIKRLSISLSCLILLFLVILFTFARFENSSDEYTMISGKTDEYALCPYNEGKTWTYGYTGAAQNFKVPCSGEYKIELWGAQGGNYNSSLVGALGGYTAGNIQLDKDLYLYIYVGNKVDYSSSTKNSTVFNNGLSSSGGYNGGGATDLRLVNGNWDNFDSIKSRIMVAGGGGVTSASTGNAGPAGGLNGYNSTNSSGTKGGTQNSYGTSGYLQSSFGIANGGCTGGNGYYPGAGAGCVYGSGGGSSYISGYSGCNAIDNSSTASNIVHTNQPNHYSGKAFTNSVMIDGKGCNWSSGTATNCGSNQPQPNGTKAVGHSGAGYAKITLISKKRIERKVNNKCLFSPGQVFTFEYNGNVQTFNVSCSGKYKIELWGAEGGNTYGDSSVGGLGAYTSGLISLHENLSLYIYVGKQGTSEINTEIFNNGISNSGGWNGGGSTDIRLISGVWQNFNSLKSRIMVAAGGGTTYNNGTAGAGGGLTGYSGGGTTGGTQTGYGAAQSASYTKSSFGIANGGCTGGNGYYPGGGATCSRGSGGGSSFISGYSGCNAITESSTENDIVHTNQPNHYSGKVFTNGVMIDGKGCNWSTGSATNCGSNQPQPDGTSAVGHSGNGYARITYISTN